MKKFSDFAKDEAILEGGKIKMDAVANRRICITAWRVSKSKYKNEAYMTVQFYFKDDPKEERHVLFTGSSVLIKQATHYNEPEFEATILKPKSYYTFS